MTIGKAASNAGVGVETIRYYERIGLIAQPAKPDENGFREYPPSTVATLSFIRSAKEVGFSLREIKELLSLKSGPDANCTSVRRQAQKKLDEMKSRLLQMQAMTTALEELVNSCPGRGAVEKCTILDSFAAA